jgi:hypothetical protein
MPQQRERKGSISYSERAFHQDAMEAMRGDIVRGIIEAVTNSDDAYASMENEHQKRILIEVEHRRTQQGRVVVRDRATGMCADDMERRLTRLGGRTSGFETGEHRRGNLGRGAKDLAAFGDVAFQSIHNGLYSKLLLKTDGQWVLNPIDRSASDADRERLGILRGNGFVVTIAVNTRCPQHENLKRKLSAHYALRDILSDPFRKVELVNLNDDSKDPLIFQYPDLPVVFETTELQIPGYPEAKASLIIWRHPIRLDEGPTNPGRPNGILLKGNRAIYDNILFGFEGNIHAGWFSGKLVCPYIDQLALEYDERLEKGEGQVTDNPMPIITRRRDGLNPQHPFVEMLKKAVEGPLGKLVAKEAERARETAGAVESETTRQALARVARELSRMVNEELRDIDAEELPPSEIGEEVPLLSLIPEQVYAYLGEDRTLTVVGRRKDIAEGAEVEVSMDPAGVVEILTHKVSLRPHVRREDVLVGQVRLRPMLENESTIITVQYESASAAALVEVRPERIAPPIIEPDPDSLQFERLSYRVGWQRKKELLLFAPAKDVARHGTQVKLSSSDPGIPVLTPSIILKPAESGKYYLARARIEARILNANSIITAQCRETLATTRVVVTRKEESGGFKIQIWDDEWGNFRAIIEPDVDEHGQKWQVIKIAGRHPAIRPYMGKNYELQNTLQAQAILAEVVADVSSRFVVSELFRRRQTTEVFDADRIYREHYKRVTRFLPRLQRALIGNIGLIELKQKGIAE